MDNVRKIDYNGVEVLIVDFSGCSGEILITIFEAAKKLIMVENKQCVILNIFDNKTYIAPGFMRHIEANLGEADKLIGKQAIIGLTTVQEWILKGMNLWYHRQIHSFATREKALEYLTGNLST